MGGGNRARVEDAFELTPSSDREASGGTLSETGRCRSVRAPAPPNEAESVAGRRPLESCWSANRTDRCLLAGEDAIACVACVACPVAGKRHVGSAGVAVRVVVVVGEIPRGNVVLFDDVIAALAYQLTPTGFQGPKKGSGVLGETHANLLL